MVLDRESYEKKPGDTRIGIAASDFNGMLEAAHVGEESIDGAASSGLSDHEAVAGADTPCSSTRGPRDLSPEVRTRASVQAADTTQRARRSIEDEVRHFNQQQAARRYERVIKVYHTTLLRGLASERKAS